MTIWQFWRRSKGLTSARRSLSMPLPGGLHPGELLTEAAGYGWTLVNAAFCYTRATGNRFNGPERGAWYAAYGKLAVETAQAEVTWHLTRELEAPPIGQKAIHQPQRRTSSQHDGHRDRSARATLTARRRSPRSGTFG